MYYFNQSNEKVIEWNYWWKENIFVLVLLKGTVEIHCATPDLDCWVIPPPSKVGLSKHKSIACGQFLLVANTPISMAQVFTATGGPLAVLLQMGRCQQSC